MTENKITPRFDSQDVVYRSEDLSMDAGLDQTLKDYFNPEAQMSPIQIEAVSAAIMSRRPGCNMLVFGLGNDSPVWANLNKSGYTLFIENAPGWVSKMVGQFPYLNVEVVDYPTTVSQSMRDPIKTMASMEIPAFLTERKWDVILVDGPMGYREDLPGRALPIYWASKVCKDSTHIFVDDYERDVEKFYADFLFMARKPNRSVVLPRPAKPRLNASEMLWLFGVSEALKTAG
ncbi:hypothetical protein [Neorhizobium sp. JUb45]|uniref:hypothetical protein n=1 Tax=unclassified Neorhizobium TaxID=2629175 RepID=UPI001052CE03|nr:hypothetical protein [Neorhizobium sp. JUb45]TCR03978.1 uncharacterized protein (TIGR01627 family) [Neorhizobium sp. JUb45]